jgi:hypothetical protein
MSKTFVEAIKLVNSYGEFVDMLLLSIIPIVIVILYYILKSSGYLSFLSSSGLRKLKLLIIGLSLFLICSLAFNLAWQIIDAYEAVCAKNRNDISFLLQRGAESSQSYAARILRHLNAVPLDFNDRITYYKIVGLKNIEKDPNPDILLYHILILPILREKKDESESEYYIYILNKLGNIIEFKDLFEKSTRIEIQNDSSFYNIATAHSLRSGKIEDIVMPVIIDSRIIDLIRYHILPYLYLNYFYDKYFHLKFLEGKIEILIKLARGNNNVVEKIAGSLSGIVVATIPNITFVAKISGAELISVQNEPGTEIGGNQLYTIENNVKVMIAQNLEKNLRNLFSIRKFKVPETVACEIEKNFGKDSKWWEN